MVNRCGRCGSTGYHRNGGLGQSALPVPAAWFRRRAYFQIGGTRGACTEPRSIASVCLITAATTKRGPPGGTRSKLISKHNPKASLHAIILGASAQWAADPAAPTCARRSPGQPPDGREQSDVTAVRAADAAAVSRTPGASVSSTPLHHSTQFPPSRKNEKPRRSPAQVAASFSSASARVSQVNTGTARP